MVPFLGIKWFYLLIIIIVFMCMIILCTNIKLPVLKIVFPPTCRASLSPQLFIVGLTILDLSKPSPDGIQPITTVAKLLNPCYVFTKSWVWIWVSTSSSQLYLRSLGAIAWATEYMHLVRLTGGGLLLCRERLSTYGETCSTLKSIPLKERNG